MRKNPFPTRMFELPELGAWLLFVLCFLLFPQWKSTVGDLYVFVFKRVPSQGRAWLAGLSVPAELRQDALLPEALRRATPLVAAAEIKTLRLSEGLLERFTASELFYFQAAIRPKNFDRKSPWLLAPAGEALPTGCHRQLTDAEMVLARCD